MRGGARPDDPTTRRLDDRLNPFVDASIAILEDLLNDLRETVADAPPDALNWRPTGDDESNSIAVLTVHVLGSTRMWLSVARGGELPERDRDAEFRAEAASHDELQAFVRDVSAECRAIAEGARAVEDWGAMRKTRPRPRPDAGEAVTAAWAFVHALEHLREHLGQLHLTSQLARAR